MTAVARDPGDSVTCVVLAAGGSSRLGTAKQLVRHRGRPLLRHAVDAAARATGRPPVVVVGADALRLRALLRRSHRSCVVVANPRWRQGMAGSVRAALAAVPREARAVLFLLTDQPFVDAAVIRRLLHAWSVHPGRPAAAGYAGQVGVPAVIPRRLFRSLARLEGDQGARGVLAAAGRLTVVDAPEAAHDVDLPEDLDRLAGGRPDTRRTARKIRRKTDVGTGR